MLTTRMAVLLSMPGVVVTAAGQQQEHCVSGGLILRETHDLCGDECE